MDSTRRIRTAIAASSLLMPAGEALALLDDRLELFAAENVTHDDNVFRLSSSVDPAAVLGTASKGDTFRTTEYGFNLNLPVSLQRLEAGVTRRLTHHERFTALDLKGYEERVLWNWQVADRANGQLGQTRSRTLASFANVQGGVQSTSPNFLTTRRSFGNAAYQATARWQIRGELERIEQDNSAGERVANDVTIDGTGLTLSYTTPPGNVVGTTLLVTRGDLPHPLGLAGTSIDNSYRQRSLIVFTQWALTEPSSVKARLGHVRRTHKDLPQRDFEGPIFGLSYEWKPSELLSFNVAAQQDISTVEEINVGFVRVKGLELQATWKPTEKLGFGARVESNLRDYLGDPSVALGLVPSPRSERVRAIGLLMDYRPTRSVTINLAWRRERRSANVAFGDYEFNAVSVGIRVAF